MQGSNTIRTGMMTCFAMCVDRLHHNTVTFRFERVRVEGRAHEEDFRISSTGAADCVILFVRLLVLDRLTGI
jgi:hypothetical protein